MIIIEKIGSFNPVTWPGFKCPICGSEKFVYLVPLGGLWCGGCNAELTFHGTCDGPNKLAIRVSTDDCWKKTHREVWASTVIWADDLNFHKETRKQLVNWMYYKTGKGEIVQHTPSP